MTNMTCDECAARLGDLLDGELDAATAAGVEEHLRGCEACRGLTDDLRQVTAAARALDRHPVPPGAWPRLAARLDGARAHGWGARLGAWLDGAGRPRPALAAGAIVLVLAAAAWAIRPASDAAAPPAGGAVSAEDAVQTVEAELALAQEHYTRAIEGLEQIIGDPASTLDQDTAVVLQRNLGIIDGAIGESRAALNAQPTSEVAQQSLFGALRSKVTLLQETVALINSMRQGDQEGAARIVSGLEQ
jgi:anti-sigma factor RsiW